jgi:hypothetical protein
MVGWKRWFYSKVGWEYDPPADEKQKRQKYLLTEQIKKSKHKLTLKDELPKLEKVKEEVIEIVKRPDTPVPVANPRELWSKQLQEQTKQMLAELEEDIYPHSDNHYLGKPKKRKRKRKTKDN